MSGPGSSGGDESESLREQVTNLEALLALSMRMSDEEDEESILRLAESAIPSLARCRLVGAHLADGGWRMPADAAVDAQLRDDIDIQLAVVGEAGGAIAVGQDTWGGAFPLRSLGHHFGYLVVIAASEPSPAAQFLLRVLAQQAGVALGNARLHAMQRLQSTELFETNRRMADTVAALERSTAIHDRLTQAAMSGEGQAGIADALHQLTGFSVAIEDRYGNLRAWAGPDRPDQYPKEAPERREALIRVGLDASGPFRHDGRLLVMAHPRDDVFGFLALVDPDNAASTEARVALEHGCTVLAMELARLSGLAETELRLGRDLVEELLSGTDEAIVIARGEALGHDLQRPHRAVVVEADPNRLDRHEVLDAVRRIATDGGAGTLLAVVGQSIVVLADVDQPWEQFRRAVAAEVPARRCRLGVGSLCDRLRDLPRSHREAVLALRVQEVVGGQRAVVFEELGVYRLFAGVEDLGEVDRFVSEWLGDLLDYDASKEGSVLVATLGQYLDCGRSYGATAEALSVHRSTLRYRLRRIREISRHDIGSPEVQFNSQLAVRAWRTLQALRDMPT